MFVVALLRKLMKLKTSSRAYTNFSIHFYQSSEGEAFLIDVLKRVQAAILGKCLSRSLKDCEHHKAVTEGDMNMLMSLPNH